MSSLNAGKGQHDRESLPAGVVVLMSVAVGASVANRYYVEPLLTVVESSFGGSRALVGLLIPAAQVGYVAGLVVLVPLGDLVERRALVVWLMLAAAGAAGTCAIAPSLIVFAAALCLLGFVAVAAQILVPLAASLAADHQRGRVVGLVTSGLLVGVLAARGVSGVIAGVSGVRSVFALAAGAMLALALLVRRSLPRTPSRTDLSYRQTMVSVLQTVRREVELRRRMLLGAMNMASFVVLWTPLTFLLSGPAYRFGSSVIGLFGFVGLAGALVAPIAGHLADRGRRSWPTTVALVAIAVSWLALFAGQFSLVALVAGIALLDLGVQGAHVSHQNAIYSLDQQARSRLNTAYMIAFFVGALAGSTLAIVIFAEYGWTGTCALGAMISVAALLMWLTFSHMDKKPLPRSSR